MGSLQEGWGGDGELTREDIEAALGRFEGGDDRPELALLIDLLDEFDRDPHLQAILVAELADLDDEGRGFLQDVSGGDGELTDRERDAEGRRVDVGGGRLINEKLIDLLDEFDRDPALLALFVAELADLDDEGRGVMQVVSGGDGELTEG